MFQSKRADICSFDVFNFEFLDLQLTHQTIFGDGPFASLTFNKKDIRLQYERELKAMLIRLRQGFIAAAANGGWVWRWWCQRRLIKDKLETKIRNEKEQKEK